tara:strand:+ start:3595 stop:3747 length:153 start_codon:yes stop_codon:yes gene_type:complete
MITLAKQSKYEIGFKTAFSYSGMQERHSISLTPSMKESAWRPEASEVNIH